MKTVLVRSKVRADTAQQGSAWWRMLLTVTLGCGVVFAALVYFSQPNPRFSAAPPPRITSDYLDSGGTAGQPLKQTVEPLNMTDEAGSRRQREVVSELARRYVGTPISGSDDDLRVLQRLLDVGAVGPEDTYELQAMGLVLGDLISRDYDLRWVFVTDDLGRSRALQYRDTRNFLFPTTMISRRVEAGLSVDVHALYDKAIDTVERVVQLESRFPQPLL